MEIVDVINSYDKLKKKKKMQISETAKNGHSLPFWSPQYRFFHCFHWRPRLMQHIQSSSSATWHEPIVPPKFLGSPVIYTL